MKHCNDAATKARMTAIDLEEQITELADSAIRLGMIELARELRGIRAEVKGMANRFTDAVNLDLREMKGRAALASENTP